MRWWVLPVCNAGVLAVALVALFWTRQFVVALTAISVLFMEFFYFWQRVSRKLRERTEANG